MLENHPKYLKLLSQPREIFSKKQYLFIISHMRARTTLLSHILGNNREICGHNELHISYRSMLDIFRLKANLLEEKNFSESTYLHDKLLHNKLSLNPSLFSNRLKIILVLREPVVALSSMAEMHKTVWGNQNYLHLESYYIERLKWILATLRNYKHIVNFIDSDQMVSHPDSTLDRLSFFLRLKVPLSKDYQVFQDTGEAGRGDPSDNIKKGEIVSTRSENRKDYGFSYSQAEEIYSRCVARLK